MDKKNNKRGYSFFLFLALPGLFIAIALALAKPGNSLTIQNKNAPADNRQIKTLKVPNKPQPQQKKEKIRIIEKRFVVKGDIPEEKLRETIKKFKKRAKDPEIKRTAAAFTKDLTYQSGFPYPALMKDSERGAKNFGDTNCPLNTVLAGQCGGDKDQRDDYRHILCKSTLTLSFYTNCNYGNWPEIVNDPRDYTDPCHTIDSGNCACGCVVMDLGDGCGPVLTCIRLIGDECVVMPHSCEQCCAGGAWIYDEETGGCACEY